MRTNASELCDDRRMRRSVFAFLLLLAAPMAVGCSSADFETANPGDDSGDDTGAGGDDTSVVDSGRDTETTDTGHDAPATDTNDSTVVPDGDATATDAIGEVITSDSGDATCSDTNVCGGCGTLSGAPGDKCGSCGVLACSGADLTCTGDHAKNECGGCATLTGHKGDSCCGGGTLGCSTDGNALICSSSGNACGGCSVLDHPPGTACSGGVCGTSKYQCSGKEATTCVDPVPPTPAFGSSCGTCGTYGCNVAGDALVCTGDHPKNACLGCATLTATPGAACGTCGKVTCATVDTTTCTEASPAPGTGCGGQCGTATYKCTGIGVSACVDPLAGPPFVGDGCNDCGSYACNAAPSTAIVCSGGASFDSRCTGTHLGCDTPTCSATGFCSYPPTDSLCAVTSSNPAGCSTETCVDSACAASSGTPASPGPTVKCGAPVSGCKELLGSDGDGDGYSTVAGCFLSASLNPDCNDSNVKVFPGDPLYYTTAMTGTYDHTKAVPDPGVTLGFDYNCDGVQTQQLTTVNGGCTKSGTTCTTKVGWEGSGPAPGCGASALYVDVGACTYNSSTLGCDISDTTKTQACR